MNKCRLLLFGATEYVYENMQHSVNFSLAELIGFVDNDRNKQGIMFHEKPIYSPKSLSEVGFDYVCVGAWASYAEVKEQLVECEVAENKIMPLLHENIHEFMHEKVEGITEDIIGRIYRHPQKVAASLKKLNVTYAAYLAAKPLEDDRDGWYQGERLIAHACGGYINCYRHPYSNSKEALMFSLQNGFRLIECDLWAESEEFYLAHHVKALWEAEGQYTLLCLKEALEWLQKYPDVCLIVDVKWAEDDPYLERAESDEAYFRIARKVKTIIFEVAGNLDTAKQLQSRVVMEVYNVATMECAVHEGFQCVYTQYRNKGAAHFMQIALDCIRHGVHVVAVWTNLVKERKKELEFFADKNVKLICYSTDDLDEYSMLLQSGVQSVFTNYMVRGKNAKKD